MKDNLLHQEWVAAQGERWKEEHIMPTIVTMLLLSMSNVLNAGFAQVLAMYNPAVYEVADIFDTYVYRQGLLCCVAG